MFELFFIFSFLLLSKLQPKGVRVVFNPNGKKEGKYYSYKQNYVTKGCFYMMSVSCKGEVVLYLKHLGFYSLNSLSLKIFR